MNLAYAYPKSRFEPVVLIDLNSKSERERLSKSALKGFFNLIEKWGVRDEDARELLGGLSSSAFYDWKKKPDRILEVDRITRVSYLIGIYKALHIIYGDKLADKWVTLPNKNVIFVGRTPLEFMLVGGVIAMQTVRALLDARRGGL
ncbi:MAG: MbcA/ParS/Xre antitoxin family protein [Sulfurimicrobium sp.]|nr:MbcA/ParS/Xre antitoxin family protein [Sulfurimicrobium sp.]